MRFFRLPAVLGLAFVLWLLPLGAPRAQDDGPLAVESVVLETASGSYMVAAEMALTPAARERGLMFRHRLPPDKGMLFWYDSPQVVSMWMKNTYIPLDMVFLRGDGSVLSVVRDTTPQSLDVIQSDGDAQAVLELAAGTAGRFGLAPGDKVIHRLFGNAP